MARGLTDVREDHRGPGQRVSQIRALRSGQRAQAQLLIKHVHLQLGEASIELQIRTRLRAVSIQGLEAPLPHHSRTCFPAEIRRALCVDRDSPSCHEVLSIPDVDAVTTRRVRLAGNKKTGEAEPHERSPQPVSRFAPPSA